MIDYNPFKTTGIAESDEMKSLFKELHELNARICLQYAEEKGTEFSIDTVLRNINALTEFDIIMFRTYAHTALTTQPETSLDINERIAIAAHEAYKQVKDLG